MKRKNILFFAGILSSIMLVVISCRKDEVTTPNPPLPGVQQSASFVEEFDNAGDLTSKGWVFKNNSNPVGATGWRQGRYEAAASKFPVPYVGFPAYSASKTPNDFISCDGSAVNDVGDISAWLISPPTTIKNGDQIIFYSRALDDAAFIFYTRDRLQVRANFTDGSANVGQSTTSVGNFTNVLLDINAAYGNNATGGYPTLAWQKYTITISGLTSTVRNSRFAFRYLGVNAGASSNATNTSSVVGVDSLAFISK